jgi:drug/metabolite transporter (DMT)-like permease
MAEFRERYGAGPLHLIAVCATAAIAGYAIVELSGLPAPIGFAVWFVGAVVAHDLVAFPLYSLLNRIAGRAAGAGRDRSAYNYVRVPAVVSAVLFVVWFPLILGLSSEVYELKSGRTTDPFLGRWLAITAALFVVSGLAYAVRMRRGPVRDRSTDPRGPRSPR